MGADYIENSNKRQKHGGVYHQTMGPRAQVEAVADDLHPIAHKCLGMIPGQSRSLVAHGYRHLILPNGSQKIGVAEKYRTDGLVIRPRTATVPVMAAGSAGEIALPLPDLRDARIEAFGCGGWQGDGIAEDLGRSGCRTCTSALTSTPT